MKILHCATSVQPSTSSWRLHKGLQSIGVDSCMATLSASVDDPSVHIQLQRVGMAFRPFRKLPDFLLRSMYKSRDRGTLYSPELSCSLMYRKINKFEADLVHLHWVVGSFIPPFALARIKKPVVWTIRDTWALTGGCHVFKGCKKYLQQCGKCPQLGSKSSLDISRLAWHAKKKAYSQLKPTLIVPSKYMEKICQNSMLFSGLEICHVPNGVDTSRFKPITKSVARKILGLPVDKQIILFGALSATSDLNKGFDLLQDTLRLMREQHPQGIVCAVFGASSGEDLPFPTYWLGRLHDSLTLALAYSAADVFVCPSREESFSNTTLEALACGTPVAGFPVGGLPDMVNHGENGWLAPAYDASNLAAGIQYILKNEIRLNSFSKKARATAVEGFSMQTVASRHKQLYERVIPFGKE